MTHPLASFPVVSTSDTDEAQFILSRELADLRFKSVRDRGSFHLEMNGVHLGGTMIAYNHFETETVVDPGCLNGAMILAMGVGSPTLAHIDGKPVVCTDRGGIFSPLRKVLIHRTAGSGLFLLRAEFAALEARLAEVLGRRPRKPIVFDRSVDLERGVGAQARRLLTFLVDDARRDGGALANPLLRTGLDDILLSTLLALPSNYSDELASDRHPAAAPRLVRRAEEFLEAHAAEPITISDVVGECGCSRRALFKAFQKHRGYAPMQFLAESRLESARDALRSLSPSDTVTSIALGSGFSHLGRFSAAYRRRFGESPSETLRKA